MLASILLVLISGMCLLKRSYYNHYYYSKTALLYLKGLYLRIRYQQLHTYIFANCDFSSDMHTYFNLGMTKHYLCYYFLWSSKFVYRGSISFLSEVHILFKKKTVF